MRRTSWTTPGEVRFALNRKWVSGALLTAFLGGQDWTPVGVPVRGPGPGEIGARLGDVQAWAADWERAGRGPLRIEYKRIGGRQVGTNTIPCRAWIDGFDEAWELLDVLGQVRRITELADATREQCPRLVPWLVSHPMKALVLEARWERLLATVRWVDERQSPGMYVRQVDVPGVDTKFIEQNRGALTALLDQQLDPDRIDQGAADFAGRYGFRRKPGYVRFRCGGYCGFRELSVRASEFTSAIPGTSRVYVIENEITYLAFPLGAGDVAIWGSGYAVPVLHPLDWLDGLDLVYWGDIDTHGFGILDRLRRRFPHARSMLMDRATLLAHRGQWVTEPEPSAAVLDLLGGDELALYRDLQADTFGPSVRLEQERVSFAAIEQALKLLARRDLGRHLLIEGHELPPPRFAVATFTPGDMGGEVLHVDLYSAPVGGDQV